VCWCACCTGSSALQGADAPGAADAPLLDAGAADAQQPDAGSQTSSGRICPDGWCWVDPLPAGESWTLRGRRSDDLWAFGTNDVDLHYDGQRFTLVTLPAPPAIPYDGQAWMFSPWLIDEGGLYRWDGQTFQPVDVPGVVQADLGLFTVAGLSDDDVWAFGGDGALHWDGTRWTPAPTGGLLTGLHATGAGDVFGWGLEGQLARFDGDSWSTFDPTPKALPACWTGPTEFIGVGGTSLWRWSDGVFTQITTSPNGRGFTGAFCTAADNVYASTDQAVARWDGVSWTTIDELHGPGDFLGFGPTDIFFQGTYGPKFRLVDGIWTPIDARVLDAPTVIAGTSSTDVWIGEGQTRIVHFDGARFSATQLVDGAHPEDPVTAIAALAPDKVFAFSAHRHGDGGVVYFLYISIFDGTWHPQDIPPTDGQPFIAAWAIAADDVWAGGNDAALHFDGQSWTIADIGGKPGFQAIWAAAKDDIWVIQGGVPVHFDGRAWTPGAVPDGTNLRSIFGRGPKDVWAAGQSGILHFDGDAWGVGPAIVTNPATVSAGPNGEIWVFDGEHDAARYSGGFTTGRKAAVPTPVSHAFAAPDGRIWALNLYGLAYRQP
jgi:hypothetical protein